MKELMGRQSQWERRASAAAGMKSPVGRFEAMGLMICSSCIWTSILMVRSARMMVSFVNVDVEMIFVLGACLERNTE